MAGSYTPRFSYRTSETAVRAYPYTAPTDVPAVRHGWVRYQGGYTGGYTGWVIPGPYTDPARFARGGLMTAKRAP